MKIFCIGLSKTGTSSLSNALKILGFNISHHPMDEETFKYLKYGNVKIPLLEKIDGIADIPGVPLFREFYREFPDSKFILTVRDKKEWLISAKQHWAKTNHQNLLPRSSQFFIRAATYGIIGYSDSHFSDVYDDHLARVVNFFSDKPNSLLIINICEGEGWEKLCPFLDKPIPDKPFPHLNKATENNPRKNAVKLS